MHRIGPCKSKIDIKFIYHIVSRSWTRRNRNLERASLSEDMSSWTTGTMPAVVALCRMEIVSMKSGKAPKNLPTRSRAELSPSSFYGGVR